jgi:hypothetical protein
MTDLEKAQALRDKFLESINNGHSKEVASREATKGHLNGLKTGEYGRIVLAYSGEYLVLFEGKGVIYQVIKDNTKCRQAEPMTRD